MNEFQPLIDQLYREEIGRLRAVPGQWDAAEKLARTLQLVTPVSGAVVFGTQD